MSNNQSNFSSGNDEIDLVELVKSLWKAKWFIAGVAILTTLVAGIYASIAEPVYEAKVSVSPPLLSDIAALNVGRTLSGSNQAERGMELSPLKVGDVYSVFIRNLTSDLSKQNFFEKHYLPSLKDLKGDESKQQLYARFAEGLTISPPEKDSPNRYRISFVNSDPETAADWVREYILGVSTLTREQVLNDISQEYNVKKHDLAQRIRLKREIALTKREDRLAALREAQVIAASLGLTKTPFINIQDSSQLSSIVNGSLMYMRGSNAIAAEINTLESRVSDDPFIPGLRDLQESLTFYEEMKVNDSKVAVFRFDGEILTPDRPIKPKKILILFLGLIIGLVLSAGIVVLKMIFTKKT